MGNETILYYVTEESITGRKRSVKPRFWQKLKLSSFVTKKGDLTVITVMIPNLQKGWKKEKLFRLMQEAAAEYPMYSENAETVIHPKVWQLSAESEKQKSDAPPEAGTAFMQPDRFPPVFWHISAEILRERFPAGQNFHTGGKEGPASVVLLLGDLFFPEEQMEKFLEMMSPFFPYVNHLTVLYKADEDTDLGTEQSRWEETINDFTQELYYEYGLVSRICGDGNYFEKGHSIRNREGKMLFLDYGYPDRIPLRMLKAGDTYLDVISSEKKETLFQRKCSGFSYWSPRKYLDTMIKSEYDK